MSYPDATHLIGKEGTLWSRLEHKCFFPRCPVNCCCMGEGNIPERKTMNYPYVTFEKEDHLYTIHSSPNTQKIVPSVTQIISENNLSFDFSQIPNLDLAWYGDRGSKVHKACEYFDQGRLDWKTVAPEIFGYVKSYQIGQHFYRFKVLETELLVFDRLERFAGTLDRIVKFDKSSNSFKGVAQIDIKSGKPHPSHGVQTAGYNKCLEGDWIEHNPHIARFGLYLDKEGGMPQLKAYPNLNDFTVFDSALNCSIFRRGC